MAFISERPKTPAAFFNRFKDCILVPLERYLVDEERMKHILRQMITGQKTLI